VTVTFEVKAEHGSHIWLCARFIEGASYVLTTCSPPAIDAFAVELKVMLAQLLVGYLRHLGLWVQACTR
jgi:hypothetical protein